MSQITNYLENTLVDMLFRGQAFIVPATLYIGLFTTMPDAGGLSGVEVSGGAYARAPIASSLTNWAGTQGEATVMASTGTGGVTSNNVAIEFVTPMANWGLVLGYGIFDAATAGNLWLPHALELPKTINIADIVRFSAGNLTVRVGGEVAA
jgi:hypothetical protein